MNKIFLVFIVLLMTFCGAWIFKSKTPLNKQLNEAKKVSNWWDTDNTVAPLSNEVSEEWYLDPRIPVDYVPVMGQDGLYMQVNEKGTIVAYWQCTEDGDVLNWEKVNPDIPDNFEAVEGLDEVYKVTDVNGIARYYKYVRNIDNSFTFVEVDSYGNIIDEFIVRCETEAASDNSIPVNYMQIDGNIYAVKNSEGVVVGYKEKDEDNSGMLIWTPISADKVYNNGGNNRNGGVVTNRDPVVITVPVQTTQPVQTTTVPDVTEPPAVTTAPKEATGNGGTRSTKVHTQKETHQEVKYEGDYKCTYEYIIIRYYDDYGNLVSSETQGPYLIDKTLTGGNDKPKADPSLIEANINNEIIRVTSLVEESSASSAVINSLNEERNSSGLRSLANGGDAQKLAVLFAADMAVYDNTTSTSPMYGSIEQLMARYNISNQGYGINIWRTTSDNASDIHKRFQSIEGCRNARMNENFNQVGVAIFSNNGYFYVAEVLLLQ